MNRLPAGFSTRHIDVAELDDAGLEPLVTLVNSMRAEREPRAVDVTVPQYRLFATSPGRVRRQQVVTDGQQEVVGYLTTSYPDDGTNPSVLTVAMAVDLEHRRRGLAIALLGEAVEIARELGRNTLAGEVYDTVPAAAGFVEAIGARTTLEMHNNVLRTDDLDLDLLAGWESTAQERATGYSVSVFEGMYPDDLIEGMTRLYVILDRDAPSPEGQEPRNWSVEFVRAWHTSFLESVDLITAVALEDSSGVPVGMSQLGHRHHDDTSWFVTTTMVDPEHRGHSLGKWVKAASCLAALERWPRVEWIETENAFTNEPMLAINREMGFRHDYTLSHVDVTVQQAEAYLTGR